MSGTEKFSELRAREKSSRTIQKITVVDSFKFLGSRRTLTFWSDFDKGVPLCFFSIFGSATKRPRIGYERCPTYRDFLCSISRRSDPPVRRGATSFLSDEGVILGEKNMPRFPLRIDLHRCGFLESGLPEVFYRLPHRLNF